MSSLTEPVRAAEFLQSLDNETRCKDEITVASGEDLVAGAVVALVLGATATADAGNTGDGTLGTITIGEDCQVGDYTVKCISTAGGVAATGTGAAVAGNTGDGTITASPATGANGKIGTYMLTCIGVDANAGEFQVEDPDGVVLGVAVVGVEFSTGSHLTFTIADGATDFDEGDAFTIVVAAADAGTFEVITPDGTELVDRAVVGTAYTSNHINFTLTDGDTDFAVDDEFVVAIAEGNVKELAPAGTDGTQIAAGVLWDAVDASAAAKKGVIVARDAEVNTNLITWPSGATAAQKAAATAQLKARGILIRS